MSVFLQPCNSLYSTGPCPPSKHIIRVDDIHTLNRHHDASLCLPAHPASHGRRKLYRSVSFTILPPSSPVQSCFERKAKRATHRTVPHRISVASVFLLGSKSLLSPFSLDFGMWRAGFEAHPCVGCAVRCFGVVVLAWAAAGRRYVT